MFVQRLSQILYIPQICSFFLFFAPEDFDFELPFSNNLKILGVSNHLNSPLIFGVNEITLILANPSFFRVIRPSWFTLFFLKYHIVHHIAKVWLKAATSENPSLRYLAGKDIETCKEGKRNTSDEEFYYMMKQNLMKQRQFQFFRILAVDGAKTLF